MWFDSQRIFNIPFLGFNYLELILLILGFVITVYSVILRFGEKIKRKNNFFKFYFVIKIPLVQTILFSKTEIVKPSSYFILILFNSIFKYQKVFWSRIFVLVE